MKDTDFAKKEMTLPMAYLIYTAGHIKQDMLHPITANNSQSQMHQVMPQLLYNNEEPAIDEIIAVYI